MFRPEFLRDRKRLSTLLDLAERTRHSYKIDVLETSVNMKCSDVIVHYFRGKKVTVPYRERHLRHELARGANYLSCVSSAWSGNLNFPRGFRFGAATAAYQVEGAWDHSDKGKSIWDEFSHTPGNVADNGTGDVACHSFHLWQDDIKMAKELGLNFYRFSISWTRILPNGFSNKISEDGRKYYDKLINGLLKVGIQPMVTIYHWDLPQRLQHLGGWSNPDITDIYADYARVLFKLYGDRVKLWLTLNEPLGHCGLGYGGTWAPGLNDSIAYYKCNKNSLIAHAKAWRIYDQEFRHLYHGKVSIANVIFWYEGDTAENEELAELVRHYAVGCYSHPIYSKKGGWPRPVERFLEKRSLMEGYHSSKLPKLTQKEIELIRGTYDFYAFNYYSARLVGPTKLGELQLDWPFFGAPDFNLNYYRSEDWPAASDWLWIHPEGLRKTLKWLVSQYGEMEFFITENGYSSNELGLHDDERVEYYYKHLEQVLLATNEDHINVTGYTAWSLMDNFEWTDGYRSKFGLYEVDFKDPSRKRTMRDSGRFYAKVIAARSLYLNQIHRYKRNATY